MPSKSRGGLSKREVAAQKAKSTKISSPVKKTSSTRSVASGYSDPTLAAEMNPVGATINPGRQNQPLVINDSGPLLPGQKRSNAKTDNKSSNNSKSSSSNNTKAVTPITVSGGAKVNTGGPIVGGAVIPSIPKPIGSISQGSSGLSGIFADIGKMWGNNGLNQASPNAFLTDSQRQSNINKSLGIEGAQAAGPSALGLALAKGSIPDSPTGYGPNGEEYYHGYDPAVNGPSILRSDFATPGTDFSRPGSESAYLTGVSPVDYGQQARKTQTAFGSSPVNPVTGATVPRRVATAGSTISSGALRTPRAVASPYIAPTPVDYTQSVPQASFEPDMTPVDSGQSGTRRRFLGNGILSNGIASNGKLDSGFDGASFGLNPMDTEENLLNQLLGIPTAQAQEMPQSPFSFDQVTPMSAFQQSFANGGLTLDQGGTLPQEYTIPSNPVTNRGSNAPAPAQVNTQNPGGSTNGGVTQQYAQGATGGSPLEGYYSQAQKGLKAQEKAQKKALNELLKSIRNQYKTQQESGLSELAKSKQQDLLKLSGLFSFANQDPNSEQRIQYETRLADDSARQQADFLAKLAAAQSQEESGARQGYQKEIANLADRRSQMQLELAKLLEDARQQQMNRSGKGVAAEKNDSLTYLGDDANGNPVYWNNRTKQQFVGSGLTRKSADPFAALLGGLGLNGTTPQ